MPPKIEDLHRIENTRQPTAGMGLALDHNGLLPSEVLSSLPGYELAYAEFTSAVTVSGTEAAPTDVVSAGAFTFDGFTSIVVEFFAEAGATATAIGAALVCNLWEASTDLGRLTGVSSAGTATGVATPLLGRRFLTPTAGSKTYKICAWQAAGNATINAGAGGVATNLPGFIRIARA